MQTRIKPKPGIAMSPEEYEAFVLEESDDRTWELVRGRLQEKPAMTEGHDNSSFELAHSLRSQLNPRHFRVSANMARVKRMDRSYFIPDVVVFPITGGPGQPENPRAFNAYSTPALLVVEVWSPSTGKYDIEEKLRAYQERGDLEIWRLHPFDHTLTVWRRRPEGGYDEVVLRGGQVTPSTLPGVTIDLDALFV